MDRRCPERQVVAAVVMVVGGCLVAGVGDLSFDAPGYTAALVCAALQAAYIMLAEAAGHQPKAGAGGPEGAGPGAACWLSVCLPCGGGKQQAGVWLRALRARFSGEERAPLLAAQHHAGSGPYMQLGAGKDAEAGGGSGGNSRRDSLGGGGTASGPALQPPLSRHHYDGDGGKAAISLTASSSAAAAGTPPSAAGTAPPPATASPGAAAAEVLHYVGLLGTPLLAAALLLTDEPARLGPGLATARVRVAGGAMLDDGPFGNGAAPYYTWLAVTSVAECALTGSMVLCAGVTGALTTSIVGVLKGVAAVVLGFFLLGGVRFAPLNVAGITVRSMRLAQEVYAELKATGPFDLMSRDVDEAEHSLELHSPYIFHTMRGQAAGYTLVPIMVGALTTQTEALFGKLLGPYLDDPTNLFVVSSDFCHWGSRFSYTYYNREQGQIWESIKWLDELGIQAIESGDPAQFAAYQEEYRNTICGRHPIGVFLNMLQHSQLRHEIRFTHYDQSSKCVAQNQSSVSYASAVVRVVEP
ncbi:Protein MEMO1 [Tetrabaena socialis]|uniref:Protein MEMO1 n=1 Tax=Tetrabaena socialis TaxID=47790 RepID=A0A2J8A595_9CHLO|nr:Protein MEMO1 [Tetrabaena socialis]|eukprot:PNH07699.1 Protein MEMO1 [Tetrabaena socialis]